MFSPREFPSLYDRPILIVEDTEVNRVFLEKTLATRGFSKLLAVASGEEALAVLDSFMPDLVVLDVLMPGIDGFECCKRIRQNPNHYDLPVLIQTTITEPELKVKAFENGATDFISKPIYPDELCARVLVHLEKRIYLRELQLYKERVEIELENARQLQQDILPKEDIIGLVQQRCNLDIASYFQPSSEIGGDFWGINNLFPHQTAFWMTDFSGHGVAAALNAFRLQAYLKEHSPQATRPGEYLSLLNDKMLNLLARGQFATMFYGIVDTQSNTLFYATACSPHPVILRHKEGKAELIDGSSAMLGIGMQIYPTHTIPFHHGDTLILYSDAFTETPKKNGDYISEEEIMELLAAHKGASAEALCDTLLDYFRTQTDGILRDDLTLVVCRRAIGSSKN